MSYDIDKAVAAMLYKAGEPLDGYKLLKAEERGPEFVALVNYGIGGIKQVRCELADLGQLIGAYEAGVPAEGAEAETDEDEAPVELPAAEPMLGEPVDELPDAEAADGGELEAAEDDEAEADAEDGDAEAQEAEDEAES